MIDNSQEKFNYSCVTFNARKVVLGSQIFSHSRTSLKLLRNYESGLRDNSWLCMQNEFKYERERIYDKIWIKLLTFCDLVFFYCY